MYDRTGCGKFIDQMMKTEMWTTQRGLDTKWILTNYFSTMRIIWKSMI